MVRTSSRPSRLSRHKSTLRQPQQRRVKKKRVRSTSKRPKPLTVKLPRLPKWRLVFVWAVLVSGAMGLGWRLYQLQVVQASELKKRAEKQQIIGLRPYLPRRTIIDSQGNVLATDRLAYTLYVHPKMFKVSQEEIATQLALILENKSKKGLLAKFQEKNTGVRVVNGLSEAVADRIKQLSLDGVDLEQDYERFYPQQGKVADIIGYVDRDRQGQAGIESSQRQILQQDLLSLKIRRTGLGTFLPSGISDELLDFDDLQLQLTVDLRLQQAARNALKKQLRQYSAKRGAVIVMDAQDGSLLTLACEPTFNPNEYYKSKVELFKNWAISDLYEPGSTFKPINVALALEAGVIKPNTVVYDGGSVNIDGWTIANASKSGNGAISIARVLQTSSNVGMIQIMKRLGKEDYYQRLLNLGLGQGTGTDLPGEASGQLKSKAIFTERSIEVATTAFGQGFSLTPIETGAVTCLLGQWG